MPSTIRRYQQLSYTTFDSHVNTLAQPFSANAGRAVSWDLPQLPEMRPLELSDRDGLRALFAELQPQQSEFSFTNLYIWREAYQLRLTRVGEAVAVLSWRSDPADSFLLPPLGPAAGPEAVRVCLQHLALQGHRAKLERATQADLERLGLTDREFAIAPERDHWDYCYLVQDLIELRGNRYHGKRNHLEQFAGRYQFRYVPLTPDLVPACQELQDRWCDEKHCDLVATLRSENRAVKEALEKLDVLGVTGGCIEVEGKVEAFALGELLNPETVVIHIEKANAAFHGLYQAINQQFLEHAWSSTRCVNREQDLGVAGLRDAKQSYRPHHMVEKFAVELK